jgi:SAM-dependent methyltransferase
VNSPSVGPCEHHSDELARIESAYQKRDRGNAPSPYTFSSPGYAFFIQQLEWSLLEALRHSSVALEGARILDVGCGSGYFLHRLLEFGAATGAGVDLSPERIDTARKRYSTAHFQCANAAQLPCADAQFDIVTQFTCLSSVLDPGLRAAIAEEIWRVLRPGGVVVSFDLRPESPALRAKRRVADRRGARRERITAPETRTVAISAEELRRLFPMGSLRYESAALDFDLCAVAARSLAAAFALSHIPWLRAHAIAVLGKPDQALAGE